MNGQPIVSNSNWDNGSITVKNDGHFNIIGKNLNTFSGYLINVTGKLDVANRGNFSIITDGTGSSGLTLFDNNSQFDIDNPGSNIIFQIKRRPDGSTGNGNLFVGNPINAYSSKYYVNQSGDTPDNNTISGLDSYYQVNVPVGGNSNNDIIKYDRNNQLVNSSDHTSGIKYLAFIATPNVYMYKPMSVLHNDNGTYSVNGAIQLNNLPSNAIDNDGRVYVEISSDNKDIRDENLIKNSVIDVNGNPINSNTNGYSHTGPTHDNNGNYYADSIIIPKSAQNGDILTFNYELNNTPKNDVSVETKYFMMNHQQQLDSNGNFTDSLINPMLSNPDQIDNSNGNKFIQDAPININDAIKAGYDNGLSDINSRNLSNNINNFKVDSTSNENYLKYNANPSLLKAYQNAYNNSFEGYLNGLQDIQNSQYSRTMSNDHSYQNAYQQVINDYHDGFDDKINKSINDEISSKPLGYKFGFNNAKAINDVLNDQYNSSINDSGQLNGYTFGHDEFNNGFNNKENNSLDSNKFNNDYAYRYGAEMNIGFNYKTNSNDSNKPNINDKNNVYQNDIDAYHVGQAVQDGISDAGNGKNNFDHASKYTNDLQNHSYQNAKTDYQKGFDSNSYQYDRNQTFAYNAGISARLGAKNAQADNKYNQPNIAYELNAYNDAQTAYHNGNTGTDTNINTNQDSAYNMGVAAKLGLNDALDGQTSNNHSNNNWDEADNVAYSNAQRAYQAGLSSNSSSEEAMLDYNANQAGLHFNQGIVDARKGNYQANKYSNVTQQAAYNQNYYDYYDGLTGETTHNPNINSPVYKEGISARNGVVAALSGQENKDSSDADYSNAYQAARDGIQPESKGQTPTSGNDADNLVAYQAGQSAYQGIVDQQAGSSDHQKQNNSLITNAYSSAQSDYQNGQANPENQLANSSDAYQAGQAAQNGLKQVQSGHDEKSNASQSGDKYYQNNIASNAYNNAIDSYQSGLDSSKANNQSDQIAYQAGKSDAMQSLQAANDGGKRGILDAQNIANGDTPNADQSVQESSYANSPSNEKSAYKTSYTNVFDSYINGIKAIKNDSYDSNRANQDSNYKQAHDDYEQGFNAKVQNTSLSDISNNKGYIYGFNTASGVNDTVNGTYTANGSNDGYDQGHNSFNTGMNNPNDTTSDKYNNDAAYRYGSNMAQGFNDGIDSNVGSRQDSDKIAYNNGQAAYHGENDVVTAQSRGTNNPDSRSANNKDVYNAAYDAAKAGLNKTGQIYQNQQQINVYTDARNIRMGIDDAIGNKTQVESSGNQQAFKATQDGLNSDINQSPSESSDDQAQQAAYNAGRAAKAGIMDSGNGNNKIHSSNYQSNPEQSIYNQAQSDYQNGFVSSNKNAQADQSVAYNAGIAAHMGSIDAQQHNNSNISSFNTPVLSSSYDNGNRDYQNGYNSHVEISGNNSDAYNNGIAAYNGAQDAITNSKHQNRPSESNYDSVYDNSQKAYQAGLNGNSTHDNAKLDYNANQAGLAAKQGIDDEITGEQHNNYNDQNEQAYTQSQSDYQSGVNDANNLTSHQITVNTNNSQAYNSGVAVQTAINDQINDTNHSSNFSSFNTQYQNAVNAYQAGLKNDTTYSLKISPAYQAGLSANQGIIDARKSSYQSNKYSDSTKQAAYSQTYYNYYDGLTGNTDNNPKTTSFSYNSGMNARKGTIDALSGQNNNDSINTDYNNAYQAARDGIQPESKGQTPTSGNDADNLLSYQAGQSAYQGIVDQQAGNSDHQNQNNSLSTNAYSHAQSDYKNGQANPENQLANSSDAYQAGQAAQNGLKKAQAGTYTQSNASQKGDMYYQNNIVSNSYNNAVNSYQSGYDPSKPEDKLDINAYRVGRNIVGDIGKAANAGDQTGLHDAQNITNGDTPNADQAVKTSQYNNVENEKSAYKTSYTNAYNNYINGISAIKNDSYDSTRANQDSNYKQAHDDYEQGFNAKVQNTSLSDSSSNKGYVYGFNTASGVNDTVNGTYTANESNDDYDQGHKSFNTGMNNPNDTTSAQYNNDAAYRYGSNMAQGFNDGSNSNIGSRQDDTNTSDKTAYQNGQAAYHGENDVVTAQSRGTNNPDSKSSTNSDAYNAAYDAAKAGLNKTGQTYQNQQQINVYNQVRNIRTGIDDVIMGKTSTEQGNQNAFIAAQDGLNSDINSTKQSETNTDKSQQAAYNAGQAAKAGMIDAGNGKSNNYHVGNYNNDPQHTIYNQAKADYQSGFDSNSSQYDNNKSAAYNAGIAAKFGAQDAQSDNTNNDPKDAKKTDYKQVAYDNAKTQYQAGNNGSDGNVDLNKGSAYNMGIAAKLARNDELTGQKSNNHFNNDWDASDTTAYTNAQKAYQAGLDNNMNANNQADKFLDANANKAGLAIRGGIEDAMNNNHQYQGTDSSDYQNAKTDFQSGLGKINGGNSNSDAYKSGQAVNQAITDAQSGKTETDSSTPYNSYSNVQKYVYNETIEDYQNNNDTSEGAQARQAAQDGLNDAANNIHNDKYTNNPENAAYSKANQAYQNGLDQKDDSNDNLANQAGKNARIGIDAALNNQSNTGDLNAYQAAFDGVIGQNEYPSTHGDNGSNNVAYQWGQAAKQGFTDAQTNSKNSVQSYSYNGDQQQAYTDAKSAYVQGTKDATNQHSIDNSRSVAYNAGIAAQNGIDDKLNGTSNAGNFAAQPYQTAYANAQNDYDKGKQSGGNQDNVVPNSSNSDAYNAGLATQNGTNAAKYGKYNPNDYGGLSDSEKTTYQNEYKVAYDNYQAGLGNQVSDSPFTANDNSSAYQAGESAKNGMIDAQAQKDNHSNISQSPDQQAYDDAKADYNSGFQDPGANSNGKSYAYMAGQAAQKGLNDSQKGDINNNYSDNTSKNAYNNATEAYQAGVNNPRDKNNPTALKDPIAFEAGAKESDEMIPATNAGIKDGISSSEKDGSNDPNDGTNWNQYNGYGKKIADAYQNSYKGAYAGYQNGKQALNNNQYVSRQGSDATISGYNAYGNDVRTGFNDQINNQNHDNSSIGYNTGKQMAQGIQDDISGKDDQSGDANKGQIDFNNGFNATSKDGTLDANNPAYHYGREMRTGFNDGSQKTNQPQSSSYQNQDNYQSDNNAYQNGQDAYKGMQASLNVKGNQNSSNVAYNSSYNATQAGLNSDTTTTPISSYSNSAEQLTAYNNGRNVRIGINDAINNQTTTSGNNDAFKAAQAGLNSKPGTPTSGDDQAAYDVGQSESAGLIDVANGNSDSQHYYPTDPQATIYKNAQAAYKQASSTNVSYDGSQSVAANARYATNAAIADAKADNDNDYTANKAYANDPYKTIYNQAKMSYQNSLNGNSDNSVAGQTGKNDRGVIQAALSGQTNPSSDNSIYNAVKNGINNDVSDNVPSGNDTTNKVAYKIGQQNHQGIIDEQAGIATQKDNNSSLSNQAYNDAMTDYDNGQKDSNVDTPNTSKNEAYQAGQAAQNGLNQAKNGNYGHVFANKKGTNYYQNNVSTNVYNNAVDSYQSGIGLLPNRHYQADKVAYQAGQNDAKANSGAISDGYNNGVKDAQNINSQPDADGKDEINTTKYAADAGSTKNAYIKSYNDAYSAYKQGIQDIKSSTYATNKNDNGGYVQANNDYQAGFNAKVQNNAAALIGDNAKNSSYVYGFNNASGVNDTINGHYDPAKNDANNDNGYASGHNELNDGFVHSTTDDTNSAAYQYGTNMAKGFNDGKNSHESEYSGNNLIAYQNGQHMYNGMHDVLSNNSTVADHSDVHNIAYQATQAGITNDTSKVSEYNDLQNTAYNNGQAARAGMDDVANGTTTQLNDSNDQGTYNAAKAAVQAGMETDPVSDNVPSQYNDQGTAYKYGQAIHQALVDIQKDHNNSDQYHDNLLKSAYGKASFDYANGIKDNGLDATSEAYKVGQAAQFGINDAISNQHLDTNLHPYKDWSNNQQQAYKNAQSSFTAGMKLDKSNVNNSAAYQAGQAARDAINDQASADGYSVDHYHYSSSQERDAYTNSVQAYQAGLAGKISKPINAIANQNGLDARKGINDIFDNIDPTKDTKASQITKDAYKAVKAGLEQNDNSEKAQGNAYNIGKAYHQGIIDAQNGHIKTYPEGSNEETAYENAKKDFNTGVNPGKNSDKSSDNSPAEQAGQAAQVGLKAASKTDVYNPNEYPNNDVKQNAYKKAFDDYNHGFNSDPNTDNNDSYTAGSDARSGAMAAIIGNQNKRMDNENYDDAYQAAQAGMQPNASDYPSDLISQNHMDAYNVGKAARKAIVDADNGLLDGSNPYKNPSAQYTAYQNAKLNYDAGIGKQDAIANPDINSQAYKDGQAAKFGIKDSLDGNGDQSNIYTNDKQISYHRAQSQYQAGRHDVGNQPSSSNSDAYNAGLAIQNGINDAINNDIKQHPQSGNLSGTNQKDYQNEYHAAQNDYSAGLGKTITTNQNNVNSDAYQAGVSTNNGIIDAQANNNDHYVQSKDQTAYNDAKNNFDAGVKDNNGNAEVDSNLPVDKNSDAYQAGIAAQDGQVDATNGNRNLSDNKYSHDQSNPYYNGQWNMIQKDSYNNAYLAYMAGMNGDTTSIQAKGNYGSNQSGYKYYLANHPQPQSNTPQGSSPQPQEQSIDSTSQPVKHNDDGSNEGRKAFVGGFPLRIDKINLNGKSQAFKQTFHKAYNETQKGFDDGLKDNKEQSNDYSFDVGYKAAKDYKKGIWDAMHGRKVSKRSDDAYKVGYDAYKNGLSGKKPNKRVLKDLDPEYRKAYEQDYKIAHKKYVKLTDNGERAGKIKAVGNNRIPRSLKHAEPAYKEAYMKAFNEEVKKNLPKYVYNLKRIYSHDRPALTRRTRVNKYSKRDQHIFKVLGYKITASGQVVYKVQGLGWISANDKSVDNVYYRHDDTKQPIQKVRIIKPEGTFIYNSKNFNEKHAVRKVQKDSIIEVERIENVGGITRFYIGDGKYISSNKTIVEHVR